MDNTTTKPNGGNRYTAEFGMWQYDYPRYDKLLTSADEMFLSVQNNNIAYIKPFYAVLLSLYYNWRSLIYGNRRVWFVGKFKEIDHLISHWESNPALNKKVPLSLIRKERALYSALLEVKQLIGLGLSVRKKESLKTKMFRSAGVGA